MKQLEQSLDDALSDQSYFTLGVMQEFLNSVIEKSNGIWDKDLDWMSSIAEVTYSRAFIEGKLAQYIDWLSIHCVEMESCIGLAVRMRVEWLRRSLSCTCGALAARNDAINVLSDLSLILMV